MIPLLPKYLKFCVVGASGLLLDMALIHLLTSQIILGWNLTISKVIAAEISVFNNFIWNDVWTFRGQAINGWRAWLIRFGKFNLICVAGIGLGVLLLNAQVYGLGINMYVSNFISIVIVSVWNFLMNLRFGWNMPSRMEINVGIRK